VFRHLLWLISVAAFAQIQELATNTDGSQLFFSTPFRLKGTNQFSSFKIFRNVIDGYSLVAQTPPFVSLPNGALEKDDFHLPNVGGDGSIIAWDETTSTMIRGFVQGVQLPSAMNAGSIRLSRNGRYFVSFCCWNTADPQVFTLYDSLSGAITTISGYRAFESGASILANDGSLLLGAANGSGYFVWRNGTARPLKLRKGNLDSLKISPNGSTIFYQVLDGAVNRSLLIAQDLSSGLETTLAQGPGAVGGGTGAPYYPGAFFLPSSSDDGSRVLFLNYGDNRQKQVFAINADGSNLHSLTNEAAGIAEVLSSGDGRIGYATTQSRALLRIDVDSGQITGLLPEMPVYYGSTSPVPGSRFAVTGDGLVTAAGGSLVSLAGVSAPLILARTNGVTLQVPWDLDLNNQLTVITAAPDSPFESAFPVQPAAVAPSILDVRSSDFKTELSNPGAARPGDIIVAAMTGLGPVSVPVATGQPAPIDRLSYLVSDFSCDWGSFGPAEVLFAGLMPTTVGLYQVNLRIPVSIPASVEAINFTCTARVANQSASAQRSVPLTR
jgi:uncharacterized protein (TIGR03437 family)